MASKKVTKTEISAKTQAFQEKFSKYKSLRLSLWRGVRDLNPRGPKDHRLSRLRLQFCPFGRL
jgi:hypothetical protein